jgi:protein-S-isoprenylcysteine O-methyltransferase Ste14
METQFLKREPFSLGEPPSRHSQPGSRAPSCGTNPSGASHGVIARGAIFAFGVIAYVMFFGTLTYTVGFTTGWVVPKDINSGRPGDLVTSLLINAALLMLFVVQHTIMARPAFKRWWTRLVPAAIERSIFVALASLCLITLFWLWRPMPTVIWDLRDVPALNITLTGLSLSGYLFAVASSFMVSHFDLFGLRQVWLHFQNRGYRPIAFRLVGFYKLVRHPLMVGFLVAFWATPFMTLGHLFFAVMVTGYVLFGTWIEERDLVAHFGDDYRSYQKTVPGFIPLPPRRST